jgi:uncharacterized protein (TIGR03067 family)
LRLSPPLRVFNAGSEIYLTFCGGFVVKQGAWMALTVGLVIAVPALAAGQDKAAEIKKDLQKFAGSWVVIKADKDGQADKFYLGAKSAIDGNKFRLTHGDEIVDGTFELDPTKNPRTMKTTYTSGPNKGKSRIGIYKFEGDTFTICYSDFGKNEPPKDFATKPGGREIVIVSKRDKS